MTKRIPLLVTLIVLLLSSLSTAYSQVSLESYERPYERAFILNGGGFHTASFLGALDALENFDMSPDLLVATCGGSLAASVINSLVSSEERLEFLKSREFHQSLLQINYSHYSSLPGTLNMIRRFYTNYHSRGRALIPDIYQRHILNVDQNIKIENHDFNISFDDLKTPLLVVGSKILFNENDISQRWKGEKLFQQIFFTDSYTGQYLFSKNSPIAKAFPNSAVAHNTRTYTNIPLNQAIRASIADPFLMAPKQINAHSYATGAIDLHPIEVTKSLANEIILFEPLDFNLIEQGVIQSSFRYNPNKRVQYVKDSNLIDYFLPQPNIDEDKAFKVGLSFLKLSHPIPKDYEFYKRAVQHQYIAGYLSVIRSKILQDSL